MRVGQQSTDPIDQVLGEVPLPAPLTPEDVRLAVRALVVHAAEEWPKGPLCRNDGSSYPCRLHRWGRRVLTEHGLNDRQIEALIRHGNPFVHVPFPFVVNGPSARATPGQLRPGAGATRPGAVPPRPGAAVTRTGALPPRPGTGGLPVRPGPGGLPTRAGAVPPRPGVGVPRAGAVSPRQGEVPPRGGRPSPYQVRGQAGRPVTPPGRTVVRPGLPGRPVAPPAAAPRWPRAS